MKRRELIITLISMLLLLLIAATAFGEEEYSPYSSVANSVLIEFKISGGVATAKGETTALASGTYAKTTVYIQEKQDDLSWKTVKTASGGSSASAAYSVTSGGIYRGRVVGKVYNSSGEKVDELSKNSVAKDAP